MKKDDKRSSSTGARKQFDAANASDSKKYLVIFRDDKFADASKSISSISGVDFAVDSRDFLSSEDDSSQTPPYMLLNKLHMGILTADPDQLRKLKKEVGARSGITQVIEDPVFEIAPAEDAPLATSQLDFVQGYLQGAQKGYADGLRRALQDWPPTGLPKIRDADFQMVESILSGAADATSWHIAATAVNKSSATGRDVRVAVLDTGLDMKHPDFGNTKAECKSFIDGDKRIEADINGHGTHCCGLIAGPTVPSNNHPRYGCAYNAELFSGKVLNAKGKGLGSNILVGIEWALEKECHIISMSLGLRHPDPEVSSVFYKAGKQALLSNALLIAATGNDSDRPTEILDARLPASCKSVLAVGAIRQDQKIWYKSNTGEDILAPGDKIFSSLPWEHADHGRRRHGWLSGTSMATAIVSGIAALWAEKLHKQGRFSARDLWEALEGANGDKCVQAPD